MKTYFYRKISGYEKVMWDYWTVPDTETKRIIVFCSHKFDYETCLLYVSKDIRMWNTRRSAIQLINKH